MAENPLLISPLPDEIATSCLLKVPLRYHSTLKLVSHGFHSLLSNPSFYSHRLLSNSSEHLLFLIHPLPSSSSSSQPPPEKPTPNPPSFSLSVLNLTLNTWHRLSLSPEIKIPMFSQLVSLPSSNKLLLLGGWDPVTLDPVNHVFVIDLASGTWRRGSPMPTPRSFFAASASPSSPSTVFVAGGHDANKNALKSAEAYDVDSDNWSSLPPMEEERDECLGISFGGGFLVVSGYATESQGRFREDGEWYDPVERRWTRVDGVWPAQASSPRGSVVGRGRWRWWVEGELREFDWGEMTWKAGRKLPPTMPRGCVVDVGDGFVVIGEGGVFVVDDGFGKVSRRVETPPPGFLGLPFSTCHLVL